MLWAGIDAAPADEGEAAGSSACAPPVLPSPPSTSMDAAPASVATAAAADAVALSVLLLSLLAPLTCGARLLLCFGVLKEQEEQRRIKLVRGILRLLTQHSPCTTAPFGLSLKFGVLQLICSCSAML